VLQSRAELALRLAEEDNKAVPKVKELMSRVAYTDKRGKERARLQPISKRKGFVSLFLGQQFPKLAKVATQLLSMHTTACAAERNWSKWGLVYVKNRSRLSKDRAQKMIFLMDAVGLSVDDAEDMLDLS